MEDKINVANVATHYRIANLFALLNLSQLSLCFIERCFQMVSDSTSFLELDFVSLAKILLSSNLLIDSELEVFNAADLWLSHNIIERGKFAKDLLLKIRLSLLSKHALKYLSDKKSSFSNNKECQEIINKFSENKIGFFLNNSSSYYTTRYCKQTSFDLIVCGGSETDRYGHKTVVKYVHNVAFSNPKSVNILTEMKEARWFSKAFSVKGEIYVFGGSNNDSRDVLSVEKYSPVTNTWEFVADMYEDRIYYCGCSFMDNVIFIGQYENSNINFCTEFNTKNRKWREIASVNVRRFVSSCTLFEGRVVVSGGMNIQFGVSTISNTVEVYDHVADAWSYMPNMIHQRYCHKSVSIKNKLFMIGQQHILRPEVFDSTCNKFVLLNCPFEAYFIVGEVLSIGSKLAVICFRTNAVMYYDVENDEWEEKSCELTNNLHGIACVKLPQL